MEDPSNTLIFRSATKTLAGVPGPLGVPPRRHSTTPDDRKDTEGRCGGCHEDVKTVSNLGRATEHVAASRYAINYC